MGQRHVCTFRHAQRAAYRTAISAAQILVYDCFLSGRRQTIIVNVQFSSVVSLAA